MTIDQLKILMECIYSVLYGVISINPKTKKKLMKYKKVIRELTDKHTTRIRRRKLLLKYVFLLPILIKTVLEKGNARIKKSKLFVPASCNSMGLYAATCGVGLDSS